jgi:hypothetical protein
MAFDGGNLFPLNSMHSTELVRTRRDHTCQAYADGDDAER